MRKDSEMFLRKLLDYRKETGKDAFMLNISYFKGIPNVIKGIQDILKDLIANGCLTSQSKVANLEYDIWSYLTLDGITYFEEKGMEGKGSDMNFQISGGQLNIVLDHGKIEAVQYAGEKEEDKERPNLKVILNLWTKNPEIKLINESDIRLKNFDVPPLLMFIPSKVYFEVKGADTVYSLMALSPVSYEAITEQINTGNTTGEIIKSMLPANFKGKMGERDVIKGGIVEETEELRIWIDTYPFLVVVCDVAYTYMGEDCREIIISTPMGSREIDGEAYMHLLAYARDNARYEVGLPANGKSIYQRANEMVKGLFHNMKDNQSFFCAVEGGYGNVLKLINGLVSPKDIMMGDINF